MSEPSSGPGTTGELGYTKRPHYVPRCYMEPWGDANRQVTVRRRDRARAYPANIDDVAVKRGIYGHGSTGQRREKLFNAIEDNWKRLREELIETGLLAGADRSEAALFLALQLARTREHVAQNEFILALSEFAVARPLHRDDVRRFLRDVHLGFEPSDSEVEGAWSLAGFTIGQGHLPSREELLETSLDIAVSKVAPALEMMHWSVETCRRANLLTSDRPIMYWRPPSPQDNYRGIGLFGAVETRVPLTPSTLLVVRRTSDAPLLQRVEPKRFDAVNRTTLAQCFEFVVGTLAHNRQLSQASLRRRRPTLRFNQGPGFQVDQYGRDVPTNDVVHAWIPSPAQ
jgi:hypothetical protein